MIKPFLSVVTISFNQAAYLRACIESVISQKAEDVEYIVVDPGSIDGSREILESYGRSIDRLILEPDQGPADGLNKGFARARGEIGYFLNSDDLLLPGAIARLRQLWRDNPSADVVLGGGWLVNSQGEPVRELIAGEADLAALLSGNAAMVQQGMFFRIECLRQIGGFNVQNRTCWDFELLCQLLKQQANVQVTRRRFGAFRLYSESLSGGVGGELHQARYRADLERLHQALTGQPYPSRGPGAQKSACIARLFRNPSRIVAQLRDRVFPYFLRQRWKADHASSLEKVVLP